MAGAGTDTSELTDAVPGEGAFDSLLAGMRRLTQLADNASEPEAIYRALAGELFSELGADEVQVHRLGDVEDRVTAYMYAGDARLNYALTRAERPPGVAWVASTGQSVLVSGARELAASVPRLSAASGLGCAMLLALQVRGEIEAVVVIAQCAQDGFGARAVQGAAGERAIQVSGERAMQRASVLVEQAGTALALVRARAEAGTDPVTGCMNHRAMRWRVGEEIGRATRTGGQLACLLIDLDNFKLVNDRRGHSAGDALLREVAQALMGEFRAFDRVARYGGDEFVVILAGADLESAAIAAERARERLLGVPSFDITPGVSASIGVAQWRPPMNTDMLLDACDSALLAGKRAGKGRVTRAA
jgi:diguanylate cyclase (GGDEF)-like protein